MSEITFICLSKSKKNNDYCVAGKIKNKDGTFGEWIRPLNQYGVINDYDCLYEDETSATSLHIITAEFIKPIPRKFQVENHLINDKKYWKYEEIYPCNITSLKLLCDHPKQLWTNTNQTQKGKFDQVSPMDATKLSGSLYFIFVDKLTFYSTRWKEEKIKLRGEFSYNGVIYNFKVTDIYWKDFFESRDEGIYTYTNKFLTISLALDTYTNASGEFHYKLIAEVI